MEHSLAANFLWPLSRLLFGMTVALLAANALEALQWTRRLAALTAPLASFARLGPASGAAFATAFFSPASANALLAEAHDKGELSGRELMFANLFNGLPSFLLHLPTLFLLTWPALGPPAATYAGLCLLAALVRTLLAAVAARCFLPPLPDAARAVSLPRNGAENFREAARTAWKRFRRRLPRLIFVTVPVYALMYFLQSSGCFAAAQDWLAAHTGRLSFLKPQALGIIALHLAAETGAALSAAGSVLDTGGLSASEVVLALLVGNILSTPVRAIRHQLPSYAGFFRPLPALKLVLANQSLRAAGMICVTWLYWRLG
jgi:hypothetical protein